MFNLQRGYVLESKMWIVSAICLLSTGVASALGRGDSAIYREDSLTAKILEAVDNSVWAADGARPDKQIYIIYSPTCAWSQKFFKDTRSLTKKVQFRWIPHGGEGADWVAETRTALAVARAFEGKSGTPQDSAKAARLRTHNTGVVINLAEYIATNGGHSISYPTLIYKTENGVKVHIGNPTNINKIISEVASRPDMADYKSTGVQMASAEVQVVNVPGLGQYANRGQLPVDVLMYPDASSPVVADLEPGFSLSAEGVTETGYVVVRPFNNQPPCFILDAKFVKFSLMKIEVLPASGRFEARAGNVSIYAHPNEEAEVLTTLKKGYAVGITGRVKGQPWIQVAPFTNGVKGYVIKND